MANKRFMAAYLLGVAFLPSALRADDLPTDPDIVAGDIDISNPSAVQMLLQQTGQYGIVDWGSFSIGQGYGVQVNNGNGFTLNRVTGGDLSSIMGSLTATGSVYLVNPNGIVVGKTGVVNTGGRFVASTLDLSNGDFLNGGDATFAGESDAYVINLGKVSSLGGDVGLLARNVVNEGTVDAPNGTVGLIAGREILMRDASVADGLFSVKVGGSDTGVTEAGAIRAAAAELRAKGGNVYALAGNTDATIEATGVAKVKGRIFLTAGDQGTVKVSKTAKAKNADGTGGSITATGGTVDMAGTLDASGSQGGAVIVKAADETAFDGQILATGGDGGFVEVSGGHLTFAGDVDSGGGTLLIDPDNIEISFNNSAVLVGNSADATLISPDTLVSQLQSQDVVIATDVASSESGTILVGNSVNWSSGHSLTLMATGDVVLNASVQSSGNSGGDVTVVAGWDGSSPFDAATFDAAVLTSQGLFGKSNTIGYTINGTAHVATGSVQVADPNGFQEAAVGSQSGATRVYANNLTLNGGTGSDSGSVFAQIGYNVTGTGDQGTVSGDITVRAAGNIQLHGGTQFETAAQIGHVGLNTTSGLVSPATVLATGAISVEAGGDLSLIGGTSASGSPTAAFAMIGNGSMDFNSILLTGGARAGNITVTSGGNTILQDGDSFTNLAWIGHQGDVGGAGNTTMTAAGFFQSVDTTDSVISVPMLADETAWGDVRVTTTASGLTLLGTTSNGACECSTIDTAGNLFVQTTGDLTLGDVATGDFFYDNSGGGSIVLASGANVVNNAGSGALGPMGPGVWLIYSDRPDHDTGTLGTLAPSLLFFDRIYDPKASFDAAAFSNRTFFYRSAPVITVPDATITYGDTYVPVTPVMTVNGSSEVISDPASWGFQLSDSFVDDGVASFSADGFVNAGVFANALISNVTATAAAGAVSSFFVDFGQLTVNQASIAVTLADQTHTYDGVGGYSGDVTFTGWKGSDNDSLISSGPSFAFAGGDASGKNAGAYTVSASDVTETSGNYSFDFSDTALLTIDQRVLTASIIGTPTKVYDGTTDAVLALGDIQLGNLVGGESIDVSQTVASYDSANAGTGIGVTSTLAAGDFAAGSGTLLANYVLPVSASGFGTIDQRVLTASIIGTPTKVYDGTTDAVLNLGDIQLGNLVGGESIDVSQTAASYDSANAGTGIGVTSTLAAGDFAAGSGTLLANYVLPVSASGFGTIDQRVLTASIIGTPTKVYDGTTDAVLSLGDIQLGNLVGGESIDVSQTAASYDSPHAAPSVAVTSILAAGDFAAGSGTLLANYVLPVSASGFGTIDQRVLTASIIGTPTKVYDGTTDAVLALGDIQLGNLVSGESIDVSQTAASYDSANAGTGIGVTSTLAVGDFSAGSGTLLANYVLPVSASGFGTIDQRVLTASIIGTPTKVYDGTTDAVLALGDIQLGNLVGGESIDVSQTAASYDSANAGTGIGVTSTLAAGDFAAGSGTLLANYVLPVSASGFGTIDQRVLTASIIGTPTKVYDGTTDAVLSLGDIQLGNLVSGESIDVSQTTASYDSPHAAPSVAVTSILAAGDFAAGSGTLLANYVLPNTASGFGQITPRSLTATIVGNPVKPFDGTTNATLTSSNFDLSGFVLGEGAVVTQTAGQYDSAVPGTRSVTANLSPGDFTPTGETVLLDYSLPETATGNGVILPAAFTPVTPTLTTDPFPTTTLGDPVGPADVLQLIDTETTQQILDEINAGANFCREFVQQEYAIDCLSDRLQSVADGLSSSGEYSEVKAALEDAARKLHAIAIANASSVLNPQVARSTTGPLRTSSRPLTAVSADSLLVANAEARAILAQTQVVLLRSGSQSERRRVAFQQVGTVLGTTATILRSS